MLALGTRCKYKILEKNLKESYSILSTQMKDSFFFFLVKKKKGLARLGQPPWQGAKVKTHGPTRVDAHQRTPASSETQI